MGQTAHTPFCAARLLGFDAGPQETMGFFTPLYTSPSHLSLDMHTAPRQGWYDTSFLCPFSGQTEIPSSSLPRAPALSPPKLGLTPLWGSCDPLHWDHLSLSFAATSHTLPKSMETILSSWREEGEGDLLTFYLAFLLHCEIHFIKNCPCF